ncbi:MAG: hypothetical protein JSR09_04060 [Bacteroidetes bacterium]|nr:hypothetical protein [Bacteroidota bacterium]MBS1648860.1 hypothetical protein [Bacteroidota bacterium]
MPKKITNQQSQSQRQILHKKLKTLNPGLLDYLPKAVCYNLRNNGSEEGLIDFLLTLEKKFNAAGISQDKQGVALVFGESNDVSRPKIKGEVTIMVVGTLFENELNNGIPTGKVKNIQNYTSLIDRLDVYPNSSNDPGPIQQLKQEFGSPGDDPNDDTSFDVGNLWP